MAILNKSFVSLSFAEDPSLNLVASDLHENMISISYGDDNFIQERGATSTILGVNFFTRATITINMSPLSSKFEIWKNRVISNGYINGSASLKADNGTTDNLKNIVISLGDRDITGASGVATFTLTCDFSVNQELYA